MTENVYLKKDYEIWVHNSSGYRIGAIDNYLSCSYSRALGSVGKFSISLPADSPEASLFIPDGIVHFMRGKSGNVKKLDFGGMADKFNYREEGGIDILTVTGSDGVRILKDRINAYPSGDAKSARNLSADSLYNQILIDNYLGTTDPDRSLNNYPFSGSGGYSIGSLIDIKFPWKKILSVYNEILNASIEKDTSPVYFDVEPWSRNDQVGWYMTIGYGKIKVNRGLTSGVPIVFSRELGNLESPEFEEDYSDEINVIYAGGEGEAGYREISTYADTSRSKRSIWSRKEAFRNFNTQQSANSLIDMAQQACSDGRPKTRFTGTLKDTPDSRYGTDWQYGDIVVVSYRNKIFDGLVSAIAVDIDERGSETIRARVEAQFL